MTPDDAVDPLREIPEAIELEPRFDQFLLENFADGTKEERCLQWGEPLRQGLCRAIVAHYQRNGWLVRWDGDSKLPYFYFQIPPPPKRRHWYTPWR